MRDLIMNVCPDCRSSMNERYALWPEDMDEPEWRECDVCIYHRTYLGYAYELNSRSRRRPSARPYGQHAGVNSKQEEWREFRRQQTNQ